MMEVWIVRIENRYGVPGHAAFATEERAHQDLQEYADENKDDWPEDEEPWDGTWESFFGFWQEYPDHKDYHFYELICCQVKA